jgi:hypothetical protein
MVTLAALTLVHAGTPVSAPYRVQLPQQEIVTTIPDGPFDPQALIYRGAFGLERVETILDPPDDRAGGVLAGAELAQALQDASGLNVTELARLLGVSRASFHEWLKVGGMSVAHSARLQELLDTIHTLREIRGDDLPVFLRASTPAGHLLDMLASGDASAVVGFALRPGTRATSIAPESTEARQISGVPGWLRSVRPLSWTGPRLNAEQLMLALDDLNPSPRVTSAPDSPVGDEDDLPAVVSRGFYME